MAGGEDGEAIVGEAQSARERLVELVQEHRLLRETMQRREHEARMATLTSRELSGLSEETPIFRTLGKCFLLSTMSSVREKLSTVATNAASEREKLTGQLSALEEAIKAAEGRAKSLRDNEEAGRRASAAEASPAFSQ